MLLGSNCDFTEDIFESDSIGKDWNYKAMNKWDNICQNGKLQSPIDLPRSRDCKFFNYKMYHIY